MVRLTVDYHYHALYLEKPLFQSSLDNLFFFLSFQYFVSIQILLIINLFDFYKQIFHYLLNNWKSLIVECEYLSNC